MRTPILRHNVTIRLLHTILHLYKHNCHISALRVEATITTYKVHLNDMCSGCDCKRCTFPSGKVVVHDQS